MKSKMTAESVHAWLQTVQGKELLLTIADSAIQPGLLAVQDEFRDESYDDRLMVAFALASYALNIAMERNGDEFLNVASTWLGDLWEMDEEGK